MMSEERYYRIKLNKVTGGVLITFPARLWESVKRVVSKRGGKATLEARKVRNGYLISSWEPIEIFEK
jgi:hypothetical protein